MTLVTVTVVVIALLIATLAFYLYMIGGVLNDVAGNLEDCRQNVKKVAYQAEPVQPGMTRLNQTNKDLLKALQLLVDGAESLAAKLAPAASPAPASPAASAAPPPARATSPQPPPKASVGYLDSGVGVGYLDA